MKNLLLMMMFCALKGLHIKKKKTITPNNTTFQKDTQILTFKDGFFFGRTTSLVLKEVQS
jgi:hypothetical protein